MSLLILRRECGAVYPLGVVVNWLGPRRAEAAQHARASTQAGTFLTSNGSLRVTPASP